MKQRVLRIIPNSIKSILKKIYYLPVDLRDTRTKREGMIPPRSMIFIGGDDFEKTGQIFKNYFIELGNLQPTDRVLDVGCGIGRMAIPLTTYLSSEGEYWGFDIVRKGIEWCQRRISPKFGNFHFLHADIYNEEYNPNGKFRAQDFQFPFDDEFFDFVFLTSVFTHMLPLDVKNYLGEISRILKRGGKCFITFFIINNESVDLIRSGKSTLDFKYEMDGFFTADRAVPEAAIAYEEADIQELLEEHGLKLIQPTYYGSWCNRQNFLGYQDIIIAGKSSSG